MNKQSYRVSGSFFHSITPKQYPQLFPPTISPNYSQTLQPAHNQFSVYLNCAQPFRNLFCQFILTRLILHLLLSYLFHRIWKIDMIPLSAVNFRKFIFLLLSIFSQTWIYWTFMQWVKATMWRIQRQKRYHSIFIKYH